MSEKPKEKVVMFCPDCLQKMHNNPNTRNYRHVVENGDCQIVAVQLSEDFAKIAKIVRGEGEDFENWELICPA